LFDLPPELVLVGGDEARWTVGRKMPVVGRGGG